VNLADDVIVEALPVEQRPIVGVGGVERATQQLLRRGRVLRGRLEYDERNRSFCLDLRERADDVVILEAGGYLGIVVQLRHVACR